MTLPPWGRMAVRMSANGPLGKVAWHWAASWAAPHAGLVTGSRSEAVHVSQKRRSRVPTTLTVGWALAALLLEWGVPEILRRAVRSSFAAPLFRRPPPNSSKPNSSPPAGRAV